MTTPASIKSNQPNRWFIISTAVFLLRNQNNVMANIAAINTKQLGVANNEKLKLETLVHSIAANRQAKFT